MHNIGSKVVGAWSIARATLIDGKMPPLKPFAAQAVRRSSDPMGRAPPQNMLVDFIRTHKNASSR
jgi:hypothetical protein